MSYALKSFLASAWAMGLITIPFALDLVPWWAVALYVLALLATLQWIDKIDDWVTQ